MHLENGQLDTTATASQGELQGKIELQLEKLAFQPLSKEDSEHLAQTVGMSPELAVGLLQDMDGRIELTLPVTGPLNKPNVDLSSAVQKAVGGALKKVFPPTLVVSLLTGAAKKTDPTFAPIEFAPGTDTLSEAAQSYADNVAALLTEHPKLSLKVCGRSTVQDLAHFNTESALTKPSTPPVKGSTEQAGAKQALIELGVQRKRAVRRYLVQAKDIDNKRVSECRSTFEAKDEGNPRVEISLSY